MPISGEVNRGIMLTLEVRRALKNKEEPKELILYGKKLPDVFEYDGNKTGIKEWFDYYQKQGLKDIKLYVYNRKDEHEAKKYAEGIGTFLILQLDNKCVLFKIDSDIDKEKDAWQFIFASYKEAEHAEIKVEEKLEEFKKVLLDIGELANDLNCPGWKEKNFDVSYRVLTGEEKLDKKEFDFIVSQYPNLEEKYLRILIAGHMSDVFGGMGSWNDSAAWEAGRDMETYKRYMDLSTKLALAINNCYMYVANESIKL